MNRVLRAGFLGSAFVTISGCTGSIDGGSIAGVFGGIKSAIVKGPETVEINWTTNASCSSYKIFQLASSTSDAIAQTTIPPFSVKTPNVQSDHSYSFAVGCVDASGSISGIAVSKIALTWPKFNGIVTSSLDTTGAHPLVTLNWNFQANTQTVFQVYAQQSTVPGDLSSWTLTQPSGYGTQYSETPLCETSNNQIKIGPGAECNSASLVAGNIYNFKVVAKYLDGTYSTDLTGNGTSVTLPALFTPPSCVLTTNGIGAEIGTSYLYLRCSSDAGSGACGINNVSVKAYQAVSGVRTAVSDTMNGVGTLRIAPQIASGAANDRIVENLELEYTCSSLSNAKAIVRYDGTDTRYQKPSLKFGSSSYEGAPSQATTAHPAFLGKSVVVGDFNCDGKPDLAVGLPNYSFNYSPYFNKNEESGAVKIYYDYTMSATGAITAGSTQYLSFRDLPPYAHFGQSLSTGNINKDINYDGVNSYGCDDLIIGAPGVPGINQSYRGNAYIFFGQPQGFPMPLDSASVASNSPTCSAGSGYGQVCAPVKLNPDMTTYFHLNPIMTNQNQGGVSGSKSSVGFSVAYIRDFNADGYGDVAIGDPYCRWDGEAVNHYTSSDHPPMPPLEVGCVYVYFGGPQGLQITKVGSTPNEEAELDSPFVKVYPPIPQPYMHFGWSISGGGDVDGKMPVPVPQNGGPGIILANGDDFIVGAPGFSYNPPADVQNVLGVSTTTFGWTPDEVTGTTKNCSVLGSANCRVDPLVMQGPAGKAYDANETGITGAGNKVTAPLNGAWTSPSAWNGVAGFPVPSNANLAASTGISFLYLGRAPYKNYPLTILNPISGNGFSVLPNGAPGAGAAPSDMSIAQMFSNNLHDRQNGSQFLTIPSLTTTSPTVDWTLSPVDSFYNCGSRGGPVIGQSGTGYYKHISCLAGRNNFSIVYPTSGAVATNFGQTVAIAGLKEQNAVALYQLGSVASNSAYSSATGAGSKFDMKAFAQGNVQERVRGESLWELGVQGLNAPNSSYAHCDLTTSLTSPYLDSSCQNNLSGPTYNYYGSLARSTLGESYSFPSNYWNAPANVILTGDINRDGYADVLVTSGSSGSTNGKLYTYFGNYAADFSYQSNSYSSSAGCSVTRAATPSSATFGSTGPTGGYSGASGTYLPFSTFKTRAAALNDVSYQITAEYPNYLLPDSGQFFRAAYIGDISESSSISLPYPSAAITRTPASLSSCYPQVKTYVGTPTSLSVADINNDGIQDAVVGFSAYNSSAGFADAALSSSGANGIASDMNFSVSAGSAQLGTSVTATNWKFIDETVRRDLFAGAPGYQSGAGSIYNYTGAGSASLSTTASYQFLETGNAPNSLQVEQSKIIGDINGDGYDDMLVPVKRFDSNGAVYYDAMIYFGSSFGPVTYNFCVSRLSSIVTAGGTPAAVSDCLGTSISQSATLSSVLIRLPQYLSKATGMGNSWALNVFAAGDVNRDGYQDLAILDYDKNSFDLFFGSSSGLINGQPILGPSLNQGPQMVSQNPTLVSVTYGSDGYGYQAALPSWFSMTGVNLDFLPKTQYPFVHGDFNGDGFEDIAFAMSEGKSPAHAGDGTTNGAWSCKDEDYKSRPEICANASLSYSYPSAYPGFEGGSLASGPAQGKALDGAGYVVVFYGGVGGYQTPVDSSTGLAADFPGIDEACTDNYGSCTPSSSNYTGAKATNAANKMLKGVYGSIAVSGAVPTKSYTLDPTLTACSPSTKTDSHPYYSCSAAVIRNPIFYNTVVGSGTTFNDLAQTFGSTLSVADVNGDGIDDLVVGVPNASHPSFFGRFAKFAGITTSADNLTKGVTFIYYGAKGAGVVAPDVANMVGNAGLGLADTSDSIAASVPVFQIYPRTQGNVPPLDLHGCTVGTDCGRQFGLGMTTGDFNGDGIDDVAISTRGGEVYVYYGPICQVDNSQSAVNLMYSNVNKACLVNKSASSLAGTNLSSATEVCGTDTALSTNPLTVNNGNQCTVMNLNQDFTLSANLVVTPAPAPSKTLYPQAITVTGAVQSSLMGSAMLSKRPIRSPASMTAVKWPGNINGDAEHTSDLIVGTYFMNDPNVTAGVSGYGQVYFGHKAPVAGSMPTIPGLYASGSASYNGGIVSQTLSSISQTAYYYSSVLLKPYTPDASVGSFFLFGITMGDLNGDGTGDLLLPTREYYIANDPTNPAGQAVIRGGGFKLIY